MCCLLLKCGVYFWLKDVRITCGSGTVVPCGLVRLEPPRPRLLRLRAIRHCPRAQLKHTVCKVGALVKVVWVLLGGG